MFITLKPHKPHYENVPFEIPDNWVWTTLEEICLFLSRGKSPKYSDTDKTYPVFAQKCNLKEGGISLEQARFLDPSTICKWSEEYKLKTGDVLVNSTGTGTVGRTRLFHESYLKNYPFVVPDSHVSVIRTTNEIKSEFVFAYISSQLIQRHLEDNLAGSTNQKELYIGVLSDLSFPLPPLAEQQRIVVEIEKWFALIDQIEQGKANLQTTIKQTKSKILDLAIHGKLVLQDPHDEPAIELLKRINPDFTPCDNGHYTQLPDGWCTTTLKDLCENINGLWKGKQEPFVHVGVIRNANFTKDFKLDYSNIEYIDVEQRTFSKRHLMNGDLIVEKSGGSDNNPVGRTILYEGESGVFSFSNFTMVLRIKHSNTILSKFLYYYILAIYQKGAMRLMQTQTTGLHNLILDNFLSIPVHIPSLSEQERIVNRIESIFTSLDTIMESL
ncbi:type I restriction modification DNA specificity domain protein [Bacteroides ovatus str. 3725 D9 iii]|uniref:restriction endonuclease subunit S n=2 Tax=Bacteroides ovatus TaxID=28116 RepID=UPI0004D512B9|nr:restriction endonuclease subunit S [Bacteroides ovatus]KDS23997.1 type I restriction modification DNA specificity domain protein [Bacteroides ovatus str. 3725 D9 iii]MCS2379704.1 restriction endonuclease subunit S [Bacteroides ovatus]